MKLIYVMDPLCGWCFGNSDNTLKLFDKYSSKIVFEVFPAGMWTGSNKKKQIQSMADYFLKHDLAIEQKTGVKFGEAYFDFVKNNDVILDSEIPSRAIITVKEINPELVIPFAVKVQQSRYCHGKDLNLEETYYSICEQLNIDVKLFSQLFNSEQIKRATQDSFLKAAEYAQAYPTLLFEKDGVFTQLEQGYAPFDELDKKIQELIN